MIISPSFDCWSFVVYWSGGSEHNAARVRMIKIESISDTIYKENRHARSRAYYLYGARVCVIYTGIFSPLKHVFKLEIQYKLV